MIEVKSNKKKAFQSISVRLFKVILFLYIFITLITTISHTLVEYFQEKNKLNIELEKVPNTFGPSLSEALWSYDYKILREIMLGMFEKKEILGIVIRNENNKVIMKTGIVKDKNSEIAEYNNKSEFKKKIKPILFFYRLKNKSFKLYYFKTNEKFFIGTFDVFYDFRIIYTEIFSSVMFISINSIFFIILLVIFINYIIKRILGNPLVLLTEKVKKISLTKSKSDTINNCIINNNELKILENSFNLMIKKNSQQFSKLQKSEEKYKRIIDNLVSSFIYRYNTRRIFTYVSPSITDIVGYTQDEFLKHYTEYITDSQINKNVKIYSELSMKGIQQLPYEIEILHKNGNIHYLEVAEVPVRNSTGKVIAVEGIAYDITKRKIAENKLIDLNIELDKRVKKRTKELENKNVELIELNQKLKTADKTKSIFLANMSHEIRTPLNTIIGFTDILLKKITLDEETRKHLRIINTSGDNLLGIINDILTMSKIESGYIKYYPEVFNLYNMIRDLEDMFQLKAAEKGIFLKKIIETDIPKFIKLDKSKLRQVLTNLLSNALKFTNKGGIYIRVKSKPSKYNKYMLYFEIEDTGIGINKKDIEKIFKPFERSIESDKIYYGTGLGLTICKKYIELMKGTLSLRSKPGKGTVFFVKIPVIQSHESTDEPDLIYDKILKVKSTRESYKILIVDDIENNRLVLEKVLSSAGFMTETAENGIQAVEKTKIWNPHLILMDIRMPVLNGIEATKQIKKMKDKSQLPIIAVTASVFDEKIETKNDCFDDYIRKPFKDREVFEKLKKFLDLEYDYDVSDKSNKEQKIIFPSNDICNKIKKSAKIGEITSLNNIISSLNNDEKYKLFIVKINKYLKKFNFEKIIDFLENN